jgi:hypothetical protein
VQRKKGNRSKGEKMNQIIKLHIGLYRFIKQELPKKKKLAEIIKFTLNITKAYIKELIRLYKDVFLILDVDYQKKQKELKKYNQIKVDLERCLKMLRYLDSKMDKAGINRQTRRRFWRDFYKDGQLRKDVFNDLVKDINKIP